METVRTAAAALADATRRTLSSDVGVRLVLFPAVVVATAVVLAVEVISGWSLLETVWQGLALLSVPALLVGLATLISLDPAEGPRTAGRHAQDRVVRPDAVQPDAGQTGRSAEDHDDRLDLHRVERDEEHAAGR